MKKQTSKHDQFEMSTFIPGLAVIFHDIFFELHNFTYYMTFKKEMKEYYYEFNDSYEKPVVDLDFFDDVNDPVVQHCQKIAGLISDCWLPYLLRHGLDDELLFDDEAIRESGRYGPSTVRTFKKKSYSFMKLSYERFLEHIALSLYYSCCALTLNSYLIPLKMRVNIDYSDQGSFRYLNMDNYDVAVLTELISTINEERISFFKKV